MMPQDFDSVYKLFYERLFQKWNIPVETEVEVSKRARTIDLVIKCESEHLKRLKNTAFCFFRRINSLEIKSPEDRLSIADYMFIVSRAYALLAKQKEDEDKLPSNATITVVCSVRPDKILDNLKKEFCFVPTSEPGIYIRKQEIDRRIVVATELEVVERNYSFLILAKGKKLLEFFEEIVRKGLNEYLEIIFRVGVSIDPKTLTEVVRRMREWSPEFKKNLESALENLFEFSPESIERIAPFRKALEEQRKVFEERQKVMEEEAIQAKREERIDAKQEDLSLILETKFGPLSKELISRIKAIRDVNKLTRLCKKAIQAQTLDEYSSSNSG